MKILLDGNKYSNKLEILKLFQFHLKEMYSLNYDALIDVLTSAKEFIKIIILNSLSIECINDLKETNMVAIDWKLKALMYGLTNCANI